MDKEQTYNYNNSILRNRSNKMKSDLNRSKRSKAPSGTSIHFKPEIDVTPVSIVNLRDNDGNNDDSKMSSSSSSSSKALKKEDLEDTTKNLIPPSLQKLQRNINDRSASVPTLFGNENLNGSATSMSIFFDRKAFSDMSLSLSEDSDPTSDATSQDQAQRNTLPVSSDDDDLEEELHRLVREESEIKSMESNQRRRLTNETTNMIYDKIKRLYRNILIGLLVSAVFVLINLIVCYVVCSIKIFQKSDYCHKMGVIF